MARFAVASAFALACTACGSSSPDACHQAGDIVSRCPQAMVTLNLASGTCAGFSYYASACILQNKDATCDYVSGNTSPSDPIAQCFANAAAAAGLGKIVSDGADGGTSMDANTNMNVASVSIQIQDAFETLTNGAGETPSLGRQFANVTFQFSHSAMTSLPVASSLFTVETSGGLAFHGTSGLAASDACPEDALVVAGHSIQCTRVFDIPSDQTPTRLDYQTGTAQGSADITSYRAACHPKTCAALNACGMTDDGCGHPLDCSTACFQCNAMGGNTTCQKDAQYCDVVVRGNIPMSASCKALPMQCLTNDTCPCLDSFAMLPANSMCQDFQTGEVIVIHP
jgi:hypothetical protein